MAHGSTRELLGASALPFRQRLLLRHAQYVIEFMMSLSLLFVQPRPPASDDLSGDDAGAE